MPEIKHQFAGGRMNKDLDERLVPDGEYRDAMNIQVSTSEDSDVGTIQNILGNIQGCSSDLISPFSYTVGSIADESEDTLYWLLSGQDVNSPQPTTQDIISAINQQTNITEILSNFSNGDNDIISLKDMIVRKKTDDSCEPVFVDTFAFLLANNENVTVDDKFLIGINAEITNIVKPGWVVTGIDNNGDVTDTASVDTVLDVTSVGFTAEYDEALNTIGGYLDNVYLPLQQTLIYGQNPTYSFTFNPTTIYIRQPNWTSVPLPVGASITIFDSIGQTITQPDTIIQAITPVDIEYTSEAGIIHNYYKITLDKYWGIPFLDVDDVNALRQLMVKEVDLTASSGGVDEFLSNNLEFNVTGQGSYQITVDQGVPSGTLIINNNFEDIDEGDELSTGYGNINWPNDGDGLCVGDKIEDNNNVLDNNGNPQNTITIVQCGTTDLVVPIMNWGTGGSMVFSNQDFKTIELSNSVDFTNTAAILFNGGAKRILNFNRSNLITGINIIDDMLFWTDGYTEPKKINISRSIKGTDNSGNIHTRLVNDHFDPPLGIGTSIEVPIREDHITVVKKAPKSKLVLDLDTGRKATKNYTAIMNIAVADQPHLSSFTGSSASSNRYDFSGLNTHDQEEPGNHDRATVSIEFASDLDGNNEFTLDDWEPGKVVVLKEFDDNSAPTVPISDYRIKGTIDEWEYNRFKSSTSLPARCKIVINAIDGDPPTVPAGETTMSYAVDLFDDDSKRLFKFKFPRFSYRYKYEDNEYSTFAPWSEVAFSPGGFDYHPKKGHNIGMINRLKVLRLRNFVTDDIPEDVVAIDLLYKDDSSTNVYVVDTLSPSDEASDGGSINDWNKNRYKLTSDTIRAALPANQLLRPWDNVPKKALAQDIVGNRIVYGNYTQGYDLTVAGNEINPRFKYQINSSKDSTIKSIKSLRDYQLGVVFTDKYGRETPVLTNTSGAFKLDKSAAIDKNKLKVGLRNSNYPEDIEYYKFFIKETSGEYFNMPMDRWYDADDGNVWLSFQSSDRDKVDIDTYLILKKGEDSDSLITENARYKILAIENSAPDFIKTSIYDIGKVTQGQDEDDTDDDDDRVFAQADDMPLIGGNKFTTNARVFGSGNSLYNIRDIEDDIFVEFRQPSLNRISNRYKINAISKPDDGDFGFTIDGYFGTDIDFIFDGPSASPNSIWSDVDIQFYKSVIENKPQFDGKFFVKIYSDNVFDVNISNVGKGEVTDYNVILNKKIYLLHEDLPSKHYRNDYKIFGREEHLLEIGKNGGAIHRNSGVRAYQNDEFATRGNHGSSPGGGVQWNWINNDRAKLHHWSAMRLWPLDFDCWRAFFKNDVSTIHCYYGGAGTDTHQGINTTTDSQGYMYAASEPPIFNTAEIDGDQFRQRMPSTFQPQFTGEDPGNWTSDFWNCMKNDYKLRNHELGYQDVFFIDRGKFKGSHSDEWKPWGYNIDGKWGRARSGENRHENGIKNYDDRDSGFMDIAFGPINPSMNSFGDIHGYGDFADGDSGFSEKVKYGDVDIDPYFWNLDREAYTDTDAFFRKITPGQRFRWKEDPTQTVYTVYSNTKERRRNRFQALDKGHVVEFDDDGNEENSDNYKKFPFTYLTENYTKGTKCYFRPKMQWEPTGNGTEGVINNSSVINKVQDPTDGSLSTLQCASIKGDDWIKIHKDNYLNTYDTGPADKRSSIVPGMVLTHLGTSSVTDWTDSDGKLDHMLLVKKIEEPNSGSNHYYIYFQGYDRVSIPTTIQSAFSGAQNIVFKQPTMNGLSVNSASNINHYNQNLFSFFGTFFGVTTSTFIGIGAVGYNLEFIQPIEREEALPENPSVWETEPKESVSQDLDIYYEISENNPMYLNQDTIKTAIPVGSEVHSASYNWDPLKTIVVEETLTSEGDVIKLNEPICAGGQYDCVDENGAHINRIVPGSVIKIKRPSGVSFGVEVTEVIDAGGVGMDSPIAGSFSKTFRIKKTLHTANYTLNWHNCYSFGNGVESNRIGDNFNSPFITNGVTASTTLADKYEEEHRKYGLIYSGIYNSTSGLNNLNQFIQAEKITKDINPIYGSIQKLHMRDSDLVTLCEDKILKILAHKDALYNADGNPQLTATNLVLGTATPFVGEYGISKNPESFASESYRAYFADKVRGVILRLSKDGLTPISEHGMKDWFSDNLKLNNTISGSYDDKKDEYNVTLHDTQNTISFKENVKGWVSFKSFVPENAISCANQYYTFKNGQVWRHHDESVDRNTFYGIHSPSSFNVLLNNEPSLVKVFNTINYEGSQSKIDKSLTYSTYIPGTDVVSGSYTDNEFYNLEEKTGWFVQSIKTDLEEGTINEFIKKEGKWFNYIKGKTGSANSVNGEINSGFDNADNSFQGLGRVSNFFVTNLYGCTDNSTFLHTDGNTYQSVINYDSTVTIDDGSCISTVLGCMDPLADAGFDISNNIDTTPTSCIYYGCTNPLAYNYNASANTNDGSCISTVVGCMDDSTFSVGMSSYYTYFNYDPLANTPGTCIAAVLGCTSPDATNYNDTANTNDGSCIIEVAACNDNTACNYDSQGDQSGYAYTYDASTYCLYCGDATADNYDGASCNSDCKYCMLATPSAPYLVYVNSSQIQFAVVKPTASDAAFVNEYVIQYFETADPSNVITQPAFDASQYPASFDYVLTGLQDGTEYTIQVQAICSNTSSGFSDPLVATTSVIVVYGCTDPTACNYDINLGANTDDGSCDLVSCAGCTDQTYLEFDNTATISDPSQCINQIVYGCTDPTAFNFDSNANIDNGSCVPVVMGCMDDNLGLNGTIAALNYNANANVDDGSCTYDTAVDLGIVFTADGGAEIILTVGNLPFDSANPGWAAISSYGTGIFNSAQTLMNGDLEIGGTLQAPPASQIPFLSNNTTVLATIDATTLYTEIINGTNNEITYSANISYYQAGTAALSLTNVSDTVTITTGCTDATACNYDSSAVIDDGSCTPPDGCSDSTALNYDASITCPDNTNDCVYCETDPGITTATLSYGIGIPGGNGTTFNWAQIYWDGYNNTNTNGVMQKQQPGSNQNYYKLEYRYKIPGGTWSTWTTAGAPISNCNVGNEFIVNNTPGFGAFTLSGSSLTPNVFAFGANDGRFNIGAKWRFRIRNLCTNCSFGPTGINTWSPVFTLTEDIISTI